MKKTTLQLPEIKLVGLKVRTSYQNELDKVSGQIFPCVQKYFHKQIFKKIPERKKPNTTFCAYTEYESDYKGEYSYFIGEEVSSFDTPLPEGFETLVIEPQSYTKFTTEPNPMPTVIVNAWQEIWNMSDADLGGKRCYKTDFEIYDERAQDHNNIVLDLYIGLEEHEEPRSVQNPGTH